MSGCDALWQPVALDEEELVIELRSSASALRLAQELLRSKGAVRRVFAQGQLTHDERVLTQQEQLEEGDQVRLRFHRKPHVVPEGMPMAQVLYRDAIVMAANKPAGLLVHGDGYAEDTLTSRVHALLAREGSRAAAQAVQRLDVETSGVVLLSLTEEFQPVLDAQVAGHDMHKRYAAVIEGTLPRSKHGWLELTGPIARDRHDARKMRVGSSGKPSLTRVRTIGHKAGCSLLLIELATGRRHQIRVHLAHAGHPILGDVLYMGRAHADGLMLHAWQESFAHPVTGERVTVEAPLPERFFRLFPGSAQACPKDF